MMKEAKPMGGKFGDSMKMNPRKAMGITGDTSGGNFGVGSAFGSGMMTSARGSPGKMLSDSQRSGMGEGGKMGKDGYRREGLA